jgi:hypothetical protein
MKKLIYLICFLMLASVSLMAQEEELGSETYAPPSLGADIPIDGGLSLLLAAGAFYGGRRLHRKVTK